MSRQCATLPARLRIRPLTLALILFSCLICPSAQARDISLWEPVIERLVADGQDRTTLVRLFDGLEYDPSIMARKVDSMVRKQFEPPKPPSQRTLEQSAYRQFLTPQAIRQAVAFIREHQAVFTRAQREFGPPPELVTAIMLVETKLGSYLGEQNALEVLASLARSSDLTLIAPFMKTLGTAPERQAYAATATRDRAEWGYRELLALLRHTGANGHDASTLPGSIYGAIGICQFMPSNVASYGVDGNGDGKVDLFCPDDAIVSVANYLRGHGWHPNLTDEQTREVVYAYNHSDLYVLAVRTVADRIRDQLSHHP
jgi:membrane-bound lytic murein transglycosylase B